MQQIHFVILEVWSLQDLHQGPLDTDDCNLQVNLIWTLSVISSLPLSLFVTQQILLQCFSCSRNNARQAIRHTVDIKYSPLALPNELCLIWFFISNSGVSKIINVMGETTAKGWGNSENKPLSFYVNKGVLLTPHLSYIKWPRKILKHTQTSHTLVLEVWSPNQELNHTRKSVRNTSSWDPFQTFWITNSDEA